MVATAAPAMLREANMAQPQSDHHDHHETDKLKAKFMRQVVVSAALVIMLAPVLAFIAYYNLDPLWGVIMSICIIGVYVIRVVHEGMIRLARRLDHLAIVMAKIAENK
jgi:hypothetical protein